MRKLPVILFLLSVFFCEISLAQYNSFHNYTVEDGLPQSQANSIFQDERGYIWIGTNGGGLSRFTGKGFEVFTRKNGLASDIVLAINQDDFGNLVLKTAIGISVYDGITFKNFTISNLSLMTSKGFYQDKEGNFWFQTFSNEDVDLYYFNGKDYTKFTDKKEKLNQFSPYNTIISDPEGNILISSGNELFLYDSETLDDHELNGHPLLKDKTISLMYFDKAGYLWLFTRPDGVSTEIYRYSNKLEPIDFPDNLDISKVDLFFNDSKGDFWIRNPVNATLYQWIGGPGSDEVNIFRETSEFEVSKIKTVTEDHEGNIWFGTDGKGLYKYGGTKFVSFMADEGLSDHFIWSIYQDSNGDHWFGTDGDGLFMSDGQSLHHYPPPSDGYLGIVRAIFEYDNQLLIGTSGGLLQFNDGNYHKINDRFGLPEHTVITEVMKHGKNIWIGTGRLGVFLYDGNRIQHFNTRNSGMNNNQVDDIYRDKKGQVWISTRGGLSRYTEGKIETFHHSDYLGFTSIMQLTEDHAGNLWAATYGSGLYKIYIDQNQMVEVFKFDSDDGLSSDNVYSLLTDNEGNLWAGCQNGVDKITFDDEGNIEDIRNYDNYEGFSGYENNAKANFVDREGKLWFGTIRGAMVYHPKMDEKNTIPPHTRITGINLFYKNINWPEEDYTEYYSHLTSWTGLPVELNLPYDQNHLTFQFEGLSYTVPEKVVYQWRLEGLDEEWSPSSTSSSAVYARLDPGQYTFMVRAANNDGVWNIYPATFTFSIEPPFWGTWWFRTLLIGFIITVVVIIFWLRNKFVREKREELEQLVAFKTKKLEKQKEEILQSNKKLMDLNEEKSSIIGIVAHDLKNPLTSAITMANILKQEAIDLNDDLKSCIRIMEKSMNRMNDMINRLLDIRKIEDKIIDLRLEKVNLQQIIEDVNRNLVDELNRKKIQLSIEAEEIYAKVDPDYAMQVYENLLSNAIKFSPPQKKVRIKLYKNNGKARTEIIDQGPGLTEEDKKKVFGKFQRLSAQPTGGEHSTGLGLSIVKKYVEAMNGQVWCESEAGKGANFIVEYKRLN